MKTGVYYYIWHEETMERPGAIVPSELDDIRELGFDYLLMDLQPSLFNASRFRKALDVTIEGCLERSLELMPICNIGCGMIPECDLTEDMVARTSSGALAKAEGSGPQMSYYSRKAYEYIEKHTANLLETIRPVQFRNDGGTPVIELMEDVGYPRTLETDYSRNALMSPFAKEIAVAGFLDRLTERIHERFPGYVCLLKTFRDATYDHPRIGNMGIDYHLLAAIADGTIETTAPLYFSEDDNISYAPVEKGLAFQCRMTPSGKCRYATILCERPWFDPAAHAAILSGLNRIDGVVWYNYNEVVTSDCGLKNNDKMREKRREVREEYGF